MDQQDFSIIDQAIQIIYSSSLSEEDKMLLADNIADIPDEFIRAFVQICTEDPSTIDMVVNNMKLKIDAIQNPDKVQSLIDKEKEDLTRAMLNEG